MLLKMRKRRASSVVVAEIFLMFATVIVAYPLTGFAFGLLGSHASPGLISVGTAIVSADFSTCDIQFINTGSNNAAVTGITLEYPAGPFAHEASVSGLNLVVPAGGTASFTPSASACLRDFGISGVSTISGERFSGVVLLSNGGQAYFAGSFD